jgi:hypothetical protein
MIVWIICICNDLCPYTGLGIGILLRNDLIDSQELDVELQGGAISSAHILSEVERNITYFLGIPGIFWEP